NEFQAKYIDAAECEWQEKQARAYSRQKADDVYINSQWFALVTPSAFRFVGGRMLSASAARQAGRSAMSRAITSGMLEAAETALWSIGTTAPGTPLAERIRAAARVAPLGAAGGFIGSAVALRFKAQRRRKE